MMSAYELLRVMSDEHIAHKHPAELRFGYVLDAMGDPLPQLEIEADDGLTNSIYLDDVMLEDLMRACLDMLQEMEIARR
jgi:hypothetical protein